tara:strand:+ start:594 stop:797 length:204 start_codon:yes stop_codon:yes gene_type:complete
MENIEIDRIIKRLESVKEQNRIMEMGDCTDENGHTDFYRSYFKPAASLKDNLLNAVRDDFNEWFNND